MFERPPVRLATALGTITLVLAAAWAVPVDGHAHGGLLALPGRAHPLLVHFPIVLLLLVPALEWLGRRRPALHEAAGALLGLAVPAAGLAALAGLALVRTEGTEGAVLAAHRIGGVVVTMLVAVAWLLRPRAVIAYRFLLLATAGTLVWTAHNGGSITHGADYLTEPLPAKLKQALGIREAPRPETYATDTVFGGAVRPVLEKHCISCHGAEKQKGDYRMDSFAALLAGGKSGRAAVIPGDLLHSELARRLALDADDEKIMPPRKKPRPTAAEIALLRWWVKQGARRDEPLAAVKSPPAEIAALLTPARVETAGAAEPAYTPRVGDYAALAGDITRLEKSLGIRLVPVSRRAGDGLILRVRGAEARFGDAELAQLAPVAPYVVEAELGGTRVTDAALGSLKKFTALERLHLERTAVTGATLAELPALPRLAYLNLCGTGVTDEALAALAQPAALRQVFVFASKVTAAGVARLQAQRPDLQVGPLQAPPEEKPPAAAAGSR